MFVSVISTSTYQAFFAKPLTVALSPSTYGVIFCRICLSFYFYIWSPRHNHVCFGSR